MGGDQVQGIEVTMIGVAQAFSSGLGVLGAVAYKDSAERIGIVRMESLLHYARGCR